MTLLYVECKICNVKKSQIEELQKAIDFCRRHQDCGSAPAEINDDKPQAAAPMLLAETSSHGRK